MSRSLDNGTLHGPWERVDHSMAIESLPSPETMLDRLARLFEGVRRVVGPARAELYHRIAVRARVRFDSSDAREISESGRDEGLAARVTRGGGGMGFATIVGGSESDARWALFHAASNERPVGWSSWAEHSGEPIFDHDSNLVRPDRAALRATLRRSLTRSRETSPPSSPTWAGSWIEWGATIESWVADGGLRASRIRSRVWAMTPKRLDPAHGGGEIPCVIAGR
ncbi:MAG: hypothetical protein R3344_13010, partial [Acidobacteriota bacterium]|nr:hypothetical protein [Acidobacteriota bacterium]